MPNYNYKKALTVRQTENEIFSDRISTFGKAVSGSLTGSQAEGFFGRKLTKILLKCNYIMNRNEKARLRKGLWIYIIRERDSTLAKIGFSENPIRRLKELTKENNTILEISSTYEAPNSLADIKSLEKYLHKRFSKKRIHGEWFKNISDEEVRKMCLQYHKKRQRKISKKISRSKAAKKLYDKLSQIIKDLENDIH